MVSITAGRPTRGTTCLKAPMTYKIPSLTIYLCGLISFLHGFLLCPLFRMNKIMLFCLLLIYVVLCNKVIMYGSYSCLFYIFMYLCVMNGMVEGMMVIFGDHMVGMQEIGMVTSTQTSLKMEWLT